MSDETDAQPAAEPVYVADELRRLGSTRSWEAIEFERAVIVMAQEDARKQGVAAQG